MDVEKTIEFILSMRAKAEVEMQDLRRQSLATRNTLRRAIRLSYREARAERVRRQEIEAGLNEQRARCDEQRARCDESIARLSAEIQAFIASLRRGGNGSH